MVSCFKFEPFVTEDIAKTKMVASGFCNESQTKIITECLALATSSYGIYRLRATKHTTEKMGYFALQENFLILKLMRLLYIPFLL